MTWTQHQPRNQTHKISWSVLGPPYRHLLRSAGITEGLSATRELHQEPPSPTPMEPKGRGCGFSLFMCLRKYQISVYYSNCKHVCNHHNLYRCSFYVQQGLLRVYPPPGSSIRCPCQGFNRTPVAKRTISEGGI